MRFCGTALSLLSVRFKLGQAELSKATHRPFRERNTHWSVVLAARDDMSRAQQMNMVFDASHDDGLAIEVGQNPAEMAVQFLAQRTVAQKGAAIFGGENGVNQNLGEGLRHGTRMRKAGT